MLKTTEIHLQTEKSAIRAKLGGKKISEKNLSGATHPYGRLQEGGYAIDLQVVTDIYPPRFSTFVNKNKFFPTTTEFRNFYNKIHYKWHLRKFRNSLILRHLRTNLTQINIEKS